MKIIFTIPSLYGGGAERVLKYLVENIQTNEKFLVTLESGQKYDISQDVKYKKLTNIDGRSSTIKKIFFFIIQYFKFNFFINQEKPDIIISFLERSNIISILSLTNIKKVISIRSFISKKFNDTGFKGKIVKIFYKYLFKKVKYFVVPTYEIKDDLIKNFQIKSKNIQVIYNPIDLEKINQLKKEPLDKEYQQMFKNNKVLINLGNLTNPKGQWHLIKVFSNLKKKHSGIKLVILGEGNLKYFLVNLSNNLGLKVFDIDSDKFDSNYDIYFLGFQKNPYKFLYKSDLFVFSSLREGFPNALIEAMACELPIISSNCQSGPKEILENGKYGVLLPVFNGNKNSLEISNIEQQWIEKINEVLNCDMSQYKSLSKKRVQKYKMDNIIKIWEEYLKDLTNEK